MRHVAFGARLEVVHRGDIVPVGEQAFAQMRSDESRPAGDQYPRQSAPPIGALALYLAAWVPAVRMVGELLGSAVSAPLSGLLAAISAVGAARRGVLAGLVWAFALWCGLCGLRASDPWDGLRNAVELSAPWWLALAVASGRLGPSIAQRVWVAGAVPLLFTWVPALWVGPTTVVEHGQVRWLGPYANVHNAAMTFAVLTCVGLAAAWSGSGARRFGAAAVCAVSGLSLALTQVRTGWVVVGVFVGVWAWSLGARRLAMGGSLVIAVAVAVARRTDVVALLTGVPPPGGWGLIGTGRWAIWRDAVAAFADRSPSEWFFGLGLGGHLRLWKPVDPHAEWLSLLFQTGLVGLGLWVAGWVLWGRLLWQARRAGDKNAFALAWGLFVASASADLFSNAFMSRPTPQWIVWALIGTAIALRKPTPV